MATWKWWNCCWKQQQMWMKETMLVLEAIVYVSNSVFFNLCLSVFLTFSLSFTRQHWGLRWKKVIGKLWSCWWMLEPILTTHPLFELFFIVCDAKIFMMFLACEMTVTIFVVVFVYCCADMNMYQRVIDWCLICITRVNCVVVVVVVVVVVCVMVWMDQGGEITGEK